MGRQGNTVPPKKITITTNVVLESYLQDLVATGLYGKTTAEVAEEIVRLEIRRLVDAGRLKERLHFAASKDDTD